MNTLPAALASSSSEPVSWWISEDGQGQINMTGTTAAQAVRELLSQCSSSEERAGILAGTFDLLASSDEC